MDNQSIKEEIKIIKSRSGLITKIEKSEAEIEKLKKALEKAQKKQEELIFEFRNGKKPNKKAMNKEGGEDE